MSVLSELQEGAVSAGLQQTYQSAGTEFHMYM